ncbi:HMG-box [Basidiobolus meristosporus CBS 931.73]|uniref:HMG-box n=1 Tax=Basidiobolus meristosporus CBS 931.73 TaxID=1314790 RepID=A0A1Y1XRI7_9FUNG|nr:HMG-box [Basidiobolus meristosporus CBS 931.73]|eukprot:ORX88360.1 HMG-box [Basidiobolus meristosporus CBS 931.73]
MTRPKKTTPGANIPAQLSVADAAQLSECYASLALSMSRIAEIYKKVVENDGSLFPKKAAKDPNAPKKPFTPYIMFCNDERDNIRQKFPNYTSQQISRELGVAWKSLIEEDKAVYLTRHIRDNERYLREVEEYKAKLGPAAALDATELVPTADMPSLIKPTAFDSDSSEENLDSRRHGSKSKGRVRFSASSASEDEYEIEDDGEAKIESLLKRPKLNGHSYNGQDKQKFQEAPSITPTPESTPPPASKDRTISQKRKSKKRMK